MLLSGKGERLAGGVGFAGGGGGDGAPWNSGKR